MTIKLNHLKQPIGQELPEWQPAKFPTKEKLIGRFCHLEKLDAKRHSKDLFMAAQIDSLGQNWTYLPYGPFESYLLYSEWLKNMSHKNDPLFYAILNIETNKAIGLAALMNIVPEFGSIEVGHLNYSPLLQQTAAATEAMYLLMDYIFSLGNRRYEWKCDHLNRPSRQSALRLGFKFEGTSRQARIYRGRSRDTDYFSIIDSEWPKLKIAFEQWLSPDNFDKDQKQIKKLSLFNS